MAKPQPSQESPFSIRLFKAFGIPVRANITFIILLVCVAFLSGNNAAQSVLTIILLFGCILLHELGHALVARKFGIATSDITLTFIGGIAVLKAKPKPNAEFWIALAGPAVNLAIALVLAPFALAEPHRLEHLLDANPKFELLDVMLGANLLLALFNLVPAFPMDGGRILRALLSMALPEVRATAIAAMVGQVLALIMCVIGALTHMIGLIFVGLFVALGAGNEVSISRRNSVLSGHTVADAMQSHFTTIESGASMEAAAQMLVEGSQHDFPVVAGSEIIGLLTRAAIARGLAVQGGSGYVAGAMRRDFVRTTADTPLEKAAELFNERETGPILVMADDELLGMLTREGVSEFIMLQDARNRSRSLRD